jgi:tetratricopeptide (TPR) repeat protein
MNRETTETINQLFRQAYAEWCLARTGVTILHLEEVLELCEGDEEFMSTETYQLAHRNLGTLYHDHDQHWKVPKHIRRAIELGEAETNDLCRKLGLSEFDNGEYASAIVALETAVELDPDDEQAHYFLAWSYRKLADSTTRGSEKL